MAWLDSDWLYRIPLTIGNQNAGQNAVNAPECQFTVPTSAAHFWTNVLSTFNDVRLTAADGTTLLTFKFNGTPSQANKTATIQIDDTNHNVVTLYGSNAGNASVGAWLYYGNAGNNVASGVDANTSITTNTAKAVHVPVGTAGNIANTYRVLVSAPSVEQLYPNSEFRKQVNDTTYIFWDLGPATAGLNLPSENRFDNEEIAYIKTIIYDQDGADTTSAMTVVDDITILDNHIVRMPIKAGDHEKRYIIIMTFGLVDAVGNVRVIDQRATIHVKNLGLHPA